MWGGEAEQKGNEIYWTSFEGLTEMKQAGIRRIALITAACNGEQYTCRVIRFRVKPDSTLLHPEHVSGESG